MSKDNDNLPDFDELPDFCKKHLLESYPSYISDCEQNYKISGNPLYVWEGFNIWLKCEIPMPLWIKEYFEEVSTALTDGLWDKKNPKEIKDSDGYICECLKLKSARGRKGTPFEKYNKHERESEVFYYVTGVKTEYPNESVDSICEALSEKPINGMRYTKETIKNEYYYISNIRKKLKGKNRL